MFVICQATKEIHPFHIKNKNKNKNSVVTPKSNFITEVLNEIFRLNFFLLSVLMF